MTREQIRKQIEVTSGWIERFEAQVAEVNAIPEPDLFEKMARTQAQGVIDELKKELIKLKEQVSFL